MISSALFVFLGSLTTLLAYSVLQDNVDIDQVLSNQRLYKKYFECLTNAGQCTPDGQQLKEVLPDAIATDCQRCSEKQKIGAEKVLKFMLEQKPDDYNVLERIYDPSGYYRRKYAERHGAKLN